jgi:FkbM family methyltransferase
MIWGACLAAACGPGEDRPRLEPVLLHDEAEMAAYLEAFPRDQYRIAEVEGLGRFYVDDNAALVKRSLRAGKPWAPHLIREFETYVVPGSTVLDVGAHVGSLTVPLARMVGPRGRVYAFEPQRKIFRELVHNLRLNALGQAIPLRFALSSRPGIIEMTNPTPHDGHAHIGAGGEQAEARTLDSFGFARISLIKIDVEGHEAEVLRGGERTLRAQRPALLIEIWEENRASVLAILEDLGYSVRRIGVMDYAATCER